MSEVNDRAIRALLRLQGLGMTASDEAALQGLFDEIARLTAGREEAVSLWGEWKRLAIKHSADLAAALEALERVQERLTCGVAGKLEDKVDEALHILETGLARIGTGEALVAVQERDRWSSSRRSNK